MIIFYCYTVTKRNLFTGKQMPTELKDLPKCPIAVVLKLLSCKWKFFIIRDLLEGSRRFGELKKMTGCSQKILTVKLREMEEDGLIERRVFAEVPPRVQYTLTDIGYSIAPVLEAMAQWGTDYKQYCKIKNKLKK